MDFFSITIAMSVFAFFVFLWICFSYFRNRDLYERNSLLLKSSLFMFISFIAFHLEFRSSVENSAYTTIFSFFSFCCLIYAIITIIVLISDLYSEKIELNNTTLLAYAITTGTLYSVNTVVGTYTSGFLVLFACLIAPGVILGKGLISSKQEIIKTPFVYQLMIIIVFYALKMVNLFNNPSISPSNPNSLDSLYTMFILITLLMFYVTYILEYNHSLNIKLHNRSNILFKTLNEVKIESEKDALTRIPNRGKMNEMLDVCLQSYEEYRDDFTIAMIDVNDFKQVNDQFGHVYGDELLQEISSSLRNSIRRQDVVGRWGGDEFLIIFPSTEPEGTEVIANNILRTFDNHQVSLSIGFASASECDGLKSMLYLADTRMYEHKHEIRSKQLDNETVNL